MTTANIVDLVPGDPDHRFWIPAHRRKALQSVLVARTGILGALVPALDDLTECFKKDGPSGEF